MKFSMNYAFPVIISSTALFNVGRLTDADEGFAAIMGWVLVIISQATCVIMQAHIDKLKEALADAIKFIQVEE